MRVNFAVTDDGVNWPDEVYQSLEPAHRLVFGYGWQAWEFLEGARSWVLPGIVAGLFRLAVLLGLTEPDGYIYLAKVFFSAISLATVLAVALLARSLGASKLAAALGAAVFGLMGLSVYFAPRAMGETASALPVTLALALLLAAKRSVRRTAVAAGLLVIATMLRPQDTLFCVAALVVLVSQRRWHEMAWAGAVLGTGALAYGWLDAVTWGSWFHSTFANVSYNVANPTENGVFPVWFYLSSLVRAEPWVTPMLAGLAAYGWRDAKPVLWIIIVFVGAHSVVPHKELRYVLPAVPLLCAAAAVGLSRLAAERRSWGNVAMAVVAMLALASGVTMGWESFGPISNPALRIRPLDVGGPESRLLRIAGKRPDVCGLDIRSVEHWRTQGYTAFHKPVPLYGLGIPPPSALNYNYVIARRGEAGGDEVAFDGAVALVRVAADCTPDDAYDWRLASR